MAYILELGIAVHSVIIGIALGMASDASPARALLIALCFHQTFEGFALGVTVLEAHFSLWQCILMVVLFAITTPIGIAIGLLILFEERMNSRILATQV